MRLLVLVALLAVPAAAQDGLACVVDALGGTERLDAIETVTLTTRTEAMLGTERQRVDGTVAVGSESVRWAPPRRGRRPVVRVTPDSVVVGAGAESQALTGPAAAQIRQAAWLVPTALALRRAEVGVEGDCSGVLLLTVPDFPERLIVQLDDAGRPTLVSTFRRRGGERVYLSVRFSDYRETDGVWIPRRIEQAEGGVKTGTTTVRSAEITDR